MFKNIVIQPLKFLAIESCVLFFIVVFLAYRYIDLLNDSVDPIIPLPPSSVPMGQYSNAAVVANGEPCAKIGTDILQDGGNSVDAAIATLLCDSVVCPDLTGFGGGFLMTIYNGSTNTSLFINARETAPIAANSSMYTNDPLKSLTGALAAAVPGMFRGVSVAYNLYGGGVSWSSLFNPTIQLCEKGITISKRLEVNINIKKDIILNSGLREYFVNNQTGQLLQQGDIYTMPKLCETLRTIANEGVDALYAGTLTSQFVNDIQSAGGIITSQDLADYDVQVEDSFEIRLKNGYKLYSGLPPSSGIILAYILRILDGKLPAPNTGLDAVRLVEAFKFAYGERTHLGDHMFADVSKILEKVTSDIYMNTMQEKLSDQYTSLDPKFYGAEFSLPEDHGTENIAVMDVNGNAVAITSTINTLFGSCFVSPSTGIILNNEMDDFSTPGVTNFYGFPPSPSNFIRPFKRPMSSMCPTILTDYKDDVVLVIGGAGGSKITLATAYVSSLILWYNKTLKEAIEEPRIYHQLIPMQVDYEYGILKPVVEELKRVGHRVRRITDQNKSVVTAIHKTPEGLLTVMSDVRQQGNVSGY